MSRPRINLEATLFCGQSFAWTKIGAVYHTALRGRLVSFTQESLPSLLAKDGEVCEYFDCSFDYEGAEQHLASLDPYLARAIASFSGLRILCQDPWETTVSFILSQNNHITRIRSLYRRLSEAYGTPVGEGVYTFPRPEELDGVTEDQLRGLGVGFRAPYIIDAVAKSPILDAVHDLDDEGALSALMQIAGVGPKVGSCILLFAYQRRRIFPRDVWVKRIMGEHYRHHTCAFFAPHEGLAQQYLFHAYRSEHGRKG